MLNVMGVSYTRKMRPHEQSSGAGSLPKRFSLPEVKLPQQANHPDFACGSVL